MSEYLIFAKKIFYIKSIKKSLYQKNYIWANLAYHQIMHHIPLFFFEY